MAFSIRAAIPNGDERLPTMMAKILLFNMLASFGDMFGKFRFYIMTPILIPLWAIFAHLIAPPITITIRILTS